MIGVWLYILSILAAGILVYKFVPDDKPDDKK